MTWPPARLLVLQRLWYGVGGFFGGKVVPSQEVFGCLGGNLAMGQNLRYLFSRDYHLLKGF